MREVNFSIPNVNKASVGITTALYDRRALDCTSTLPLINSLNHLAYLTTSSARIRDILTIDGGIERLICILKQGRVQEIMEMWKWNLAFQCVVNIGVRGSEAVRTRVVEADMVPVIASILYNYVQVVDKCREKVDATSSHRDGSASRGTREEAKDNSGRRRTSENSTRHLTSAQRVQSGESAVQPATRNPGDCSHSVRRPERSLAIEIPQTAPTLSTQQPASHESRVSVGMDRLSSAPQLPSVSPVEHAPGRHHLHHHHHHTFHGQHSHHHHHHRHRSQDSRHITPASSRHIHMQSLPNVAGPSLEATDSTLNRTLRDGDRMPLMVPSLQTGLTSQPESPTTPSAPSIQSILQSNPPRRQTRRQQSSSGDSDEGNAEEDVSEVSANQDNGDEPMVDIPTTVTMDSTDDREPMIEDVSLTTALPNGTEGQETETFDITHQSANDGSIINANVTRTNNDIGFPAPAPTVAVVSMASQPTTQTSHARYLLDRSAPPNILAATPRDEDVLMSLQLLAYVSKYCNLRSFFQKTHLVPKLKIRESSDTVDEISMKQDSEEDDEEEEYLLPDDFNIFPLVEKFTVRHHSQDMQHWAGVVMRNLCRKDDANGGIRQCAYYECGQWERSARQFAKCRRCRRTKYCSKECQKNAWVFHRHWCQVASP